jgi:hypothetical protein
MVWLVLGCGVICARLAAEKRIKVAARRMGSFIFGI